MADAAFQFPAHIPFFKEQSAQTKALARAVRLFLENDLHISLEKKHFLLAVSGGADSLSLLCIWQLLRPVYDFSFSVVHINHNLRPESTQEAQTVQELCAVWEIPCFISSVDIYAEAKKHKMGIEETARHTRYAIYEQYRLHCGAAWVCLGHHLRDVQEDVFMRLLRGAGWPALGGMVASDAQRRILRPLLMQEPEQLRLLLQHMGFTWVEDASNADTTYLRNRVRHTFLPLFQAENPSFPQKIAELWQLAQYDATHWQELVQSLCEQYDVCCTHGIVLLPAKLLQQNDKATRLRLYMHALHILQKDAHEGSVGQARAHTLFQLDTALQEGRGGITFQLPNHVVAHIKKGAVRFSKT